LQYNPIIMKTDKFGLILFLRIVYLSSICGNLFLIFFAAAHQSLAILGRVCIMFFAVSNLWLAVMNFKMNHKKEEESSIMNFQE
jgi:lipid-A-disaccharide synthase-like uncharacterized protein